MARALREKLTLAHPHIKLDAKNKKNKYKHVEVRGKMNKLYYYKSSKKEL